MENGEEDNEHQKMKKRDNFLYKKLGDLEFSENLQKSTKMIC